MARILVAGSEGLAGRTLSDRLVAKIRSDGHDAFRLGTQAEGPEQAVRDADAVLALLDSACPAATAAAVAYGRALGKPVLGLMGEGVSPILADLCTKKAAASDEADLMAPLAAWYEDVRPFAGRLVRDLVPRLVKEAGHEVTFRELTDDEKPRFLKQKVAEEAKALWESDLGSEKEEIADVLEALETLIAARGYGKNDLKMVKDGKRKRRGGFEKGFVVESTAPAARHEEHADASPPARTEEPPAEAPAAQTDGPDIDFEFTDDEPPAEVPESVGPDTRVEPKTFEL